MKILRSLVCVLSLVSVLPAQTMPASPRVLPPIGDKITETDRTELTVRLTALEKDFATLPKACANANAEVFLKAVRYALDQQEFYHADDTRKAGRLLDEAQRRTASLRKGEAPWMTASGLVVRGYYSAIDGSAQPFALEVPEDAPAHQAPGWIWLQGRGDNRTDLHFLDERLRKGGQFHPPGTLIVHAWGRYCVGYKNAGEQDVLDVRALLVREQRLDPRRIALAGFSMGGAGAWMVGAHYTDLWAVMHAGAGFADVRRYRKMTDADVAKLPDWERLLWGQNDVPDYARNLLNVPVIAYSGEIDPQRATAAVMAEAFQKEGAVLTHLIGPGVLHKYEAGVKKEVEARIQQALLHPPASRPLKLTFQTRTLDYSRLHWLQVTGLERHWQDSRVDAALDQPIPQARRLELTTGNITSLRLQAPEGESFAKGLAIQINGTSLEMDQPAAVIPLIRENGRWRTGEPPAQGLRKQPELQGPIDDAFTAPFLFVLPDQPGAVPEVDAWIRAEAAAQQSRWRSLMRGDVRAKPASAVTPQDIRDFNLILWGDAASNAVTDQVLPKLPLLWTADRIQAGGRTYSAKDHVPVMIYPNPLNPARYVVLNSGLTFREAHSKTNSLQNPHLPDWAVLNIQSPPTAESAGRVEAAGFFDEAWGWR
ncbi:MAG: phospholipase/Carboxylesterase [Verrucomicrobiales bacterium]|nr:phospholipase/Carboxylesterase [Verrucomicrobiales bacterium]